MPSLSTSSEMVPWTTYPIPSLKRDGDAKRQMLIGEIGVRLQQPASGEAHGQSNTSALIDLWLMGFLKLKPQSFGGHM